MNSKDDNFENSLDSTLNMSLDEIERMLNGQSQFDGETPEYETADLESLLSELEAMDDDGDIQEISDLLDKAENNEAADPGIVELLERQDEEIETAAYDAMDLFSGEEPKQKEGFFKRLIAKFKKNNKKQEETSIQLSEGKDTLVEEKQSEDIEQEHLDNFLDEGLNGSDAIILELEREEIEKQENVIKEKPKKKDRAKKRDKTKKKAEKKEETEEEPQEQDKKKPKEKKQKVKKVKEKKDKEENIVLYDYDEVPLTKKKVGLVFFVCIMLMLAILALIINFAGHRNKKLAEEAYEEGNYLECYQLLYGQHLSEGQEVLYHKSKINLQMELLWKRYDDFAEKQQYLQGLDKLIQFVFNYSEMSAYATEWNCEEIVENTYDEVIIVLYDEYKLMEQDAIDIANIEDDVEYTKVLTSLAEKRKKGKLKYPHMLPEEERRVEESL